MMMMMMKNERMNDDDEEWMNEWSLLQVSEAFIMEKFGKFSSAFKSTSAIIKDKVVTYIRNEQQPVETWGWFFGGFTRKHAFGKWKIITVVTCRVWNPACTTTKRPWEPALYKWSKRPDAHAYGTI